MTALAEILRKMHPPAIWLGRPRQRRITRPYRSESGLAKALRSLRRSARRESPLVATRKLAAVDKRNRRKARNRDLAVNGHANWKETSWLADAS